MYEIADASQHFLVLDLGPADFHSHLMFEMILQFN